MRGCIPLCPPPPETTGIGGGSDLRLVAVVMVVVDAVMTVAVEVERGDNGGG